MGKKEIRNNFRTEVFQRDKYQCKMCGIDVGESMNPDIKLDAHHITDRSLMPNGGYVLENGISLCESCHLKAEKYHQTEGEEWEEGFHPDELYQKINSNYELAVEKSKELNNA